MQGLLDRLKVECFQFLSGKELIASFEQWVYATPELEQVLHEDDYLNLIGLDFSRQSSHYEAAKILRRYFHAGEYETWKLRTLLLTVINQEQDLRRSLCECYELYCDGYSFLDNLGLGCGLSVIVPPAQYGADNWYELSREEQQQLMHSLLPGAIAEAQTVLAWLDEGKIVITDEQSELGHYLYLDRRAAM